MANYEFVIIKNKNNIEFSYFYKIKPSLKGLYNKEKFKIEISKKVKDLLYIDDENYFF